MSEIQAFTIGFTQKGARNFFSLLNESGAKRIIDVRLNNVSQLAGFARRDDLEYFLSEICRMDYLHMPDLAPTKAILDAYKKHGMDWGVYEDNFFHLMENRCVEKLIDPEVLNGGCLLCSEHSPQHCHRRLVIEYLNEMWGGNIQVKHLM